MIPCSNIKYTENMKLRSENTKLRIEVSNLRDKIDAINSFARALIVEVFGDDNTGLDGISWSVEDFENAVKKRELKAIKEVLKPIKIAGQDSGLTFENIKARVMEIYGVNFDEII